MKRLFWILSLLLLLLGGGISCTPLSDTEQEYLDRRREETEAFEAMGDALASGEEEAKYRKKVQEAEMADGQSMEQWLRTVLAEAGGSRITSLDRWSVKKLSDTVHEVKFTYSVMDDSNSVQRKGYSWKVDDVLDQVDGPRELKLAETRSASERRKFSQQRRDKRDHAERTLE